MAEDSEITWQSLQENAFLLLFSSHTNVRVPALKKIAQAVEHSQFEKPVLQHLALLVLKTYDHYQDAQSRTEVLLVLERYIASDPAYLKVFVKYTAEISRNSGNLALTDIVTLLTWTNRFLVYIYEQKLNTDQTTEDLLKEAQMLLIFSASNSLVEGAQKPSHKERVHSACLAQTKNALSTVFSTDLEPEAMAKVAESYITFALTAKVSASVAILYIGVVSDTVHDLLPTRPAIFHHIKEASELNAKILNFFAEQVVLSKSAPSPHSILVFTKYYVKNFTSSEQFKTVALTAVEKALMRSSETALQITMPMFKEKDCVDMSEYFASSKLLTHLLNGLKSLKDTVRESASQTLSSVFLNALPTISSENTSKIVDEVFKTLKATTNVDSKVLIVHSLKDLALKDEVASKKALTTILPVVSKELNELILIALVHVFSREYIRFLLKDSWSMDDGEHKKICSLFSAGLEHSKLNLRSIWATTLGQEIFTAHSLSTKLFDFFENLRPAFLKSLAEANKSPLLTVTNKGITTAYVCISLSGLFKTEDTSIFTESLVASNDKFSILTSPKVIAKLTGTEQIWGLRALLASFNYAENIQDFAQAYLYFCVSANVSYSTRLEANNDVKKLFDADAEKASSALVPAINRLVASPDGLSDAELNYNLKHVSSILNSVLQLPSTELRAQNLVKLLVVAHHSSIPVKEQWIGLVLRAKCDPENLVSEYADILIEEAYDVLESSKEGSGLYAAACLAINTIAFINPKVIAPKIAAALRTDLSLEKLKDVNATTIKIWQAPEGEMVVDVLGNGKPKKAEDKNTKDYETRKWEESLKKELSAKNKLAKKLNREEQALVNEQLAKESAIRESINKKIKTFQRAFSVIQELCAKNNLMTVGGTEWFSVTVFSLLDLLKNPFAYELFGEFGTETFIRASKQCSRLAPLEELTGAVTLRILDIKGIPDNFLQLQLNDLLSKVLFRAKILSDDWFTTDAFLYIAPLLTEVLRVGKDVAIKNSKKQIVTSEFSDEDPEEEHLSLAMSILCSQNMLEDNWIPRRPILESLIALMKVPSKAKASKECFLTVCQQISINLSKDDLAFLLENLVVPDTFVKSAILQGIDAEFDLTEELKYSNEIWIALHDNDSNVSEVAKTIWNDSGFEVAPDAYHQLLKYTGATDSGMRLTIARSIAAAVEILLESDASVYDAALEMLITFFYEMEIPPAPPKDEYGLAVNNHSSQRDQWEERSTTALTLKYLSPLCNTQSAVEKIFIFLIPRETLGDKEDLVAQELLEAGVEIIKQCGSQFVEVLIPIFEACLEEPDKKSKKQDRIKELVIILYGSLGRHLDPNDERLKIIFERLLQTLATPSEDVQYAVSECIAPLVPAFELSLQDKFDDLFEKLWNGPNLAVRKGAAYGIAGLVKGTGIKSLFSNDVMNNILDVADDKKNEKVREGVSFVFDCLSQSLGPMFEPYVIELLPTILKYLGDPSAQVREATDVAARQIMKSTTSYGVKQLIPLAIRNLDDIAWRSKKGSVELLGSMAYLDPTQLSASLSSIVPEIVGVLNDSHKEVRKAADQALKRFGEVIRNPEIQTIVPDLIKAIGDPTKYTDDALDKLIKTQFVHYIDGPSLALIIHVIHRGMRDRSASTKKKACQIVGNMAILVDSNDLLPYLPSLVGELEIAMVDPVPETRSTGARALGSLVEKLGEDKFPDLIPRLLGTLNDSSKAGDRLGSAQALAEVICGLGLSKLDEMLPTILASALSVYSHVRAGFMPLLLYLPVCFGSQFSPYLASIIPPILKGLADTDEEIRDTALRAGRLIVKNYASKAVDLLLPELERGLSDSSYRIRLSSVELTGDLLFQVTGISGKNELTEEQVEVNRNLVEVLGQDRRDRILAALFVCRLDVTGVVRAAGVDIWKALVANTPRTIKEIIPSLTHTLVRRLASSDEVHRTIAAATLGDVVRRVGANALAQLLPSLEELLISSDTDAKQGICIALTELITSASQDALYSFQDTFIRIIRDALVDASPNVREAAAQAFEALQDRLGKVVIDEILPNLLNMLELEDSENALLALQDIMATKADVIFPILVPTLMAPPIDVFKVKALSSLAAVAGPALYGRFATIINALLQAIIDTAQNGTPEELAEVQLAFDRTLLSVDDDRGVHPVMQQLMSLVKHQEAAKRAAVCERLAVFFARTQLDYSIYVLDLVSQLIFSLGDADAAVVHGVFEALAALVKAQDKQMLDKLVKPAHQALLIAGVKGEVLPGFALPRGPSCVLPIFSHGLMYGTSEQKELSALSIAEVVDRTPPATLKPFATTVTGPLIRVIGEKVSSDTKAAILTALTSLLKSIPQFLRPFIPQLQRTFVRLLSDASNESLRSGAVAALGLLIEFQPRVDSLVTELIASARTTEDRGVKNSLLKAMLQVVVKGGRNLSETSKAAIMTLVEEELSHVDDKSAVSYARLLGSLSQILSAEEAANILRSKILSKRGDPTELKFAVLAINSFLRDAPVHVFETGLLEEIVSFVVDSSNATTPYISDNATVAIGKLMLLDGELRSPKQTGEAAPKPFVLPDELKQRLVDQILATCLDPASKSSDSRRLALVVLRTVARFKLSTLVAPYYNVVVPSVFACLRDPVIPIRLAAEKAYLAVFKLVEDAELKAFSEWFNEASQAPIKTVLGAEIQPRSIGDYTKRVANRLASVERERVEAGGDDEAMYSDRLEDENEVWAVGGY